jgi:hypothetical protein
MQVINDRRTLISNIEAFKTKRRLQLREHFSYASVDKKLLILLLVLSSVFFIDKVMIQSSQSKRDPEYTKQVNQYLATAQDYGFAEAKKKFPQLEIEKNGRNF